MKVIAEHAIVSPTSTSYCAFMVVSASGSVRMASFVVMISGQVKLFQAPMNVKMDKVSMADFIRGRTIDHRIFRFEAPSIRADSISSVGMPRIAWRMMKTPKAVGSGRISALKVFTHPIPRTTMYRGTSITSEGTSIVSIRSRKILSCPLNFSLANA